ncbi:MAG TPA: hypothetical protein VK658_14745 [Chryseolinea sp.]|nr:hypothetical protein [Chryseolinea sp.]
MLPFSIAFSICLSASVFGQVLPTLAAGFPDIHHISTRSGNPAFDVMPDGTALLIEARDVNNRPRPGTVMLKISPQLPHDSLSRDWVFRGACRAKY